MRDLQGSSAAEGCSRSLGWGDAGPAFPLLGGAPQGDAWSDEEDGACTQRQLPDLSFPEPGLKGALVPFAAGEAVDRQGLCMSSEPSCQQPKGLSSSRKSSGTQLLSCA